MLLSPWRKLQPDLMHSTWSLLFLFFRFQEKYGPKGQVKASNGTTAKPNSESKPKPDIDINVGLSERAPWFCRCVCITISYFFSILHNHFSWGPSLVLSTYHKLFYRTCSFNENAMKMPWNEQHCGIKISTNSFSWTNYLFLYMMTWTLSLSSVECCLLYCNGLWVFFFLTSLRFFMHISDEEQEQHFVRASCLGDCFNIGYYFLYFEYFISVWILWCCS